MQNLRWKIITCVAVFIIFAAVRRLSRTRHSLRPAGSQVAHGPPIEARPRPAGRRSPRAARAHRRCAAARDGGRVGAAARGAEDRGHHRRQHYRRKPGAIQSRRHRARAGRGLQTGGHHGRDELRPQPRRRRRLHLHHEAEYPGDAPRGGGHAGASDDRAARQRAGRRRAEHRAARAPTATRSSSSSRACPTSTARRRSWGRRACCS